MLLSYIMAIRLIPSFPHYRKHSVAAASRYLHLRGYKLSVISVRRYADLLDVPRIRTKSKPHGRPTLERIIGVQDLPRLELVILLKRIGLTDKEVRAWLQRPDRKLVEERVRELEGIRGDGRTLLAQLDRLDAAPSRGVLTN